MKFKPHDYQLKAIRKMLIYEHFCLFLNMGLGKTVITLTALNELIFYKKEIKRALIIAPKKVAETTWNNEARKWNHLKHIEPIQILGSKNKRLKAAQSEGPVYIINRENIPWLVDTFKDNWKWDCIVIDELSSFKNPQAKRFKKLKQILNHVKRVYGLTGTPAANGLMGLWSQIFLLDRGQRLEKTLGRYRDKYFKPDKRNGYIVYSYKLKKGAERLIRNKIADICLSINSSDYVKLPKLINIENTIILKNKALKQYQKMEREMLINLPEAEISAANAAAVTTKLLQISSGAIYDNEKNTHLIHSDKLETLKEIIEAAEDEPILVFYNFKFERDLILKNIPGSQELKGPGIIEKWNDGKIKILVAHPASCGYGINIQEGGHIIVWYSPTWNLEQYQQANARLYRQGQNQPVIINHIISQGTIDEQVINALKNKDKKQEALLKALEERKRLYN